MDSETRAAGPRYRRREPAGIPPFPEFTNWMTSEQRANRIHIHSGHHSPLARIALGYHQLTNSFWREPQERSEVCLAPPANLLHPGTTRQRRGSPVSASGSAHRRAPRMPKAMGKSKPEPSFLMSAGARLMVMWVGGNVVAAVFFNAARTRSRLSRTAASGRLPRYESDPGQPLCRSNRPQLQ